MIKLTDYRTGFAVYIDRETIKSISPLPADVEYSLRTKINTATDSFIVREPVEKVAEGCES